jgi:hypothetical protein
MIAWPAREPDVADGTLIFSVQALELNVECWTRWHRRRPRNCDRDRDGGDNCGGSIDVDGVAIAKYVYHRLACKVVAIIYRCDLNGRQRARTKSAGAKSKSGSSIC